MLLKPDKAANLCDSYRPLSIINIDAKILAKIIASRLQPLVPSLVLPDQTEFVPTRSTMHNLRTVFATLHYFELDFQAVAVLLDAAKAFDSLQWEYTFTVLLRMGLPPFFLKWICILYTAPEARILVNGWVSEAFPIHRGTRQGCPVAHAVCACTGAPCL